MDVKQAVGFAILKLDSRGKLFNEAYYQNGISQMLGSRVRAIINILNLEITCFFWIFNLGIQRKRCLLCVTENLVNKGVDYF